ncbi:hypothetical protein ACCC88_07620 [Sphingomonas sp. Sphisp140]|uniref:hypothetical protein n=1 Tax=unclassified Sphingomonas TaxID=196159 RepID=UPI0039B0B134
MACQVTLLLAPGLLVFAPPVRGTMLLVPLYPASAATVEAVGDQAGATLGGVGPLPRSRFVDGDRARLLPAALHSGMILVSISPQICGEFQMEPQQ